MEISEFENVRVKLAASQMSAINCRRLIISNCSIIAPRQIKLTCQSSMIIHSTFSASQLFKRVYTLIIKGLSWANILGLWKRLTPLAGSTSSHVSNGSNGIMIPIEFPVGMSHFGTIKCKSFNGTDTQTYGR